MTLPDAVAFFHEHAGWSYQPATETAEQGRLRCARSLADAEAWARVVGLEFAWEEDWATDHQREFDCYADGGPDTCEGCVAYYRGEVVASLWCIDDASDAYRRVVEAELANEARAEVRRLQRGRYRSCRGRLNRVRRQLRREVSTVA